MYFSKKRRYLTEINVIPYVDVMLVLLVIFMVTAPFMIQGIDIDLPEVNSQPIEKANLENVTISINSKGEYFIDLDSLKDEIFKINELREELTKILKNNSSIEIYIRADKNVIFAEVAKLMSLLQDLKPSAINFITEPIDDK
ncbi:MAG: ExbD/TolR family protein [Gammaproteobacteria bacterium]|tara:strand:+ start:89 stop:514 length:426 start_codon:yes stop_codon:yes gene_type:complete